MTKNTMHASRLHAVGDDMKIETVDRPSLRTDEVLVRVEACSVVQNLANVLESMKDEDSAMAYPTLPAIFGLDVAGTIETCGELVTGLAVGDRVYINPGLGCGGCKACRTGREIDCDAFALRGYFSMSEKGQQTLDQYPVGGFAEMMPAPQRSVVRIPDKLDFPTAARLGYLGTAYRALKLGNCGPGKIVYVDGISGTLGLGAVALALALGADKVLGAARNTDLFAKVKALGEPGQVEILESGTRDVKEWARDVTGGRGVDIAVDALGGGSPVEPLQQALYSLNRGGSFVNIGAMTDEVPISLMWAMSNNIRILSSSWFTTAEAQEMADMVQQGRLDLTFFETEAFPLTKVNEAIAAPDPKRGGFANYVVTP